MTIIGGGLYIGGHYLEYLPTADSRARAIHKQKISPDYESIRDDDVKRIKRYLDRTASEIKVSKSFLVIVGPRGVGKTVAVDWAARDFNGVIKIRVQPEENSTSILDKVCSKITNRNGSHDENEEFMKSVIERYREKYADKVPIVIISAAERQVNQEPAELITAARDLVEYSDLNVIIDCEENAYQGYTVVRRETILNIEPMTDEMIRKLPEFEELFEVLKKQGNEEFVLAVCGGVPQLIKKLDKEIKSLNIDGKLKGAELESEQKKIVDKFLARLLRAAEDEIDIITNKYPIMKEFLKKFEGKESVRIDIEEFMALKTPSTLDFKGVLRKVKKDNRSTLVPADGAAAVLLRYGIEKEFDLNEIKKAVSN